MNETTDSILVECPCEREAYRDKQNYPYRKDNVIKLTCVPTLMNWNNPAIRLDDSQSSNFSEITESQTSSFSEITDTQDPNWEDVA